MEQILIRNLPAGTKASLRRLAEAHNSSIEAEAREILARALTATPVSMADLLAMPNGDDIEFELPLRTTSRRLLDL